MFFHVSDDEEDEEDEAYYTDAFDGMKQRMTTLNGKTDKMEKASMGNWQDRPYHITDPPPSPIPLTFSEFEMLMPSNSLMAVLFQGGADPEEDPLKWIEENIPESTETENPLPVIDSDEEIETVITNKRRDL